MNKVLENTLIAGLAGGAVFVMIGLILALSALIGGTVLYFLWPAAVPAIFPGLVADGTLYGDLTFNQACAVSLFLSIVFRVVSNVTVKSK
jgi:hypothetical protein